MSNQLKNAYISGFRYGHATYDQVIKFDQKQNELEAQGYIVFNPVQHVKDMQLQDSPMEVIMSELISCLMYCDELHLLPCWQQSEWSRLERDIMHKLRKTVVYPK